MSNRSAFFISLFCLPLALLSISFAEAAPIDGADEKAKAANSKILESVIRIDMSAYLGQSICSSTLISKNILLTALHCTVPLRENGVITLNGNRNYRIVKIIKPASMSKKNGDHELGTDMALILFTADTCAQGTLASIAPIKVVTQNNKAGLSNEVLLAGYGITSVGGHDSGTLNAGYNQWTVSDYSKVKNSKAALDTQKFMRESMKFADEQLVLLSSRRELTHFKNEAGKPIGTDFDSQMLMKERTTLTMEGDSGGPAIAFDQQGTPFVVGVTSGGNPDVQPKLSRLLALTQDQKVLAEVEVPATEFGMFEATQSILEALLNAKLINAQQIVQIPFDVVEIKDRRSLVGFTSLTHPTNGAFLDLGLKALEKVRDQARNYCQ